MSQNSVNFSGDPSGDELLDDLLSDQQENILTNNIGTTRPSYADIGTDWIDNSGSPWIWKMFNGTNDIIIGYIDPTSLKFTVGDGVITNAKMANMNSRTWKGNITGSPAAPADLTENQMRSAFNIVHAQGNVTGATTLDLNNGRSFTATCTGNVTWTFSNPLASGYEDIFTLLYTNGGANTNTWPASVIWVAGNPPALTASGKDELSFKTVDGGTTWTGLAALDVK